MISTIETDEILDILSRTYPDVHCGLNFVTPFQLLVATMLSAQSTDKTVNRVTIRLFSDYPALEDFLNIEQGKLEEEIKEIGLYRSKAKNILAMCKKLSLCFDGGIPSNMGDLISLPGVGRKTANVVLSNAFGIPALAVDTHVFRVSNRIGLAESKNVEGTEKQLLKNIPSDKWSEAHHWLIWHGRLICNARSPKCSLCMLAVHCRYFHNKNI